MDKNDILMIARSLYLQQSIARQLFAKFDIDKQLNQLDGSFDGAPSQDLYSKFCVFIGSNNKTSTGVPILQFIKKNGTKFTVYGLTKNAQIDPNYSHEITGWNRLAVYLNSISAKITASNKSFHAKIKLLLNTLTTQLYDKYKNEQQFNGIYVKLNQQLNGKQLDDELIKRQTEYVVDAWLNDLINQLDNIQNIISSMHVFTISNSINSIPAYISQLRQIINKKGYEYIDKNVRANDAEKSSSAIQSWLLNNTIVGEIQNTVRNDLHTSQNNVKNVTTKISNVWQRVYEINQHIIMFNRYKNVQIVSDLLKALNESNTDQQFADAVINLGFKYKFNTKEQLNEKYNIDIEDGVDLLRQRINQKGEKVPYPTSNKKQVVEKMADYVNGYEKSLKFTTWYKFYQIIISMLQGTDSTKLFDKFNELVAVFADVEFYESRYKYLKAYRTITTGRKNGDITTNNAQQIMDEAIREMQDKFVGVIEDGDVVINNIIDYYSKAGGTVQNVMSFGVNFVPYVWVDGTKIISQIKNFIDAVEQQD